MLNGDSLSPFKDLMEVLFSAIMDVPAHRAEGRTVAAQVESLLAVLRRKEKVSVNSIVKRLAVMHSLVHKFAVKEYWHEELAEVLRGEVNRILREDLQEVASYERKEKRENSLSKLYHYVRELSGSRERGRNRLEVEGQSDKGTLNEMASKVMQPFCLYLLKILQDNAVYCSLVRNQQQTSPHEVDWKVINWGRTLSDVVLQLSRLSRYFKADMLGVLVYLAYLLSVDLSVRPLPPRSTTSDSRSASSASRCASRRRSPRCAPGTGSGDCTTASSTSSCCRTRSCRSCGTRSRR